MDVRGERGSSEVVEQQKKIWDGSAEVTITTIIENDGTDGRSLASTWETES